MCGYPYKLGAEYQAAYYRDKLAAAEHALANAEAENRRLNKFIAREGKRVRGLVHRCVQDAIDNG